MDALDTDKSKSWWWNQATRWNGSLYWGSRLSIQNKRPFKKFYRPHVIVCMYIPANAFYLHGHVSMSVQSSDVLILIFDFWLRPHLNFHFVQSVYDFQIYTYIQNLKFESLRCAHFKIIHIFNICKRFKLSIHYLMNDLIMRSLFLSDYCSIHF